MDLKEVLGDEQYEAIVKKLDGKQLMVNDGNFIPKSRLDEEIAKKKKLEEQLTESQAEQQKKIDSLKSEYEKQIKDMTAKLKNFEGSEKQKADLENMINESNQKLEELTKKNEAEKLEYEEKLKRQKFDAMIEVALLQANARKTKAVRALLDENKISLDGDNLLGLNDQLTALKESDPYLFGETKLKGADVKDAGVPTPNVLNVEKIKTMSTDDIVANFDEVMKAMKRK